jgi:plastocyanin
MFRKSISLRGIAILLAGTAFAAGADIRGTIHIERELTHHNVTAPAGIYQRGVAVKLGEDPDTDAISFERSHVAVYIESAGSVPADSLQKASIEQRDRRFAPDLVVIPAGSSVAFPNFDPVFHNVFSLSKAKGFDLGNYPKGQSRTVTFQSAGIVAVYCHLHPNMAATIVVAPTRWATRADRDGEFTLENVPPGTYTVVAWHKVAGTFKKTVTIGEGQDVEVRFTLPYVEPPKENGAHHK